MSKIDVSIIIVSYNTREYLVKCIESLTANPIHFKYEIIVVDNNSRDDSVAFLKNNYPAIDLRIHKENRGFADANNTAFNTTSSKYVILLNPDTVVTKDALNVLYEFMEHHTKTGIVAPMLLNEDLSLQHSVRSFPNLINEIKTCFGLPKYFGSHSFLGHHRFHSRTLSKPVVIDQPQGACLMVRRKAISDGFLFDPRFFMYYEEVDLCYRIKRNGWQIYYIPEAKIIHAAGKSYSKNITGMIRHQYRSKFIYYRKNYGEFPSSILIFLTIYEMGYRMIMYYLMSFLLSKNRKEYWFRLKAYFKILSCLLRGRLP